MWFVSPQAQVLARGQRDLHRLPARHVVQPTVRGAVDAPAVQPTVRGAVDAPAVQPMIVDRLCLDDLRQRDALPNPADPEAKRQVGGANLDSERVKQRQKHGHQRRPDHRQRRQAGHPPEARKEYRRQQQRHHHYRAELGMTVTQGQLHQDPWVQGRRLFATV
ncbi:MAG TPA: hypothetical protein PK959_06405 [Candidatus Competibacteraceae bacterium]|nr:hypothetical protein [Candidatus Competibacteraceae bacterium]